MTDELIEEKFKVANHRIDDLETEVKDIKELTIAITKVNEKVEVLADCVGEIKTDIKEMKKVPSENYNKLKMALACAAGSGIVGYVIGAIFKQ